MPRVRARGESSLASAFMVGIEERVIPGKFEECIIDMGIDPQVRSCWCVCVLTVEVHKLGPIYKVDGNLFL